MSRLSIETAAILIFVVVLAVGSLLGAAALDERYRDDRFTIQRWGCAVGQLIDRPGEYVQRCM